MTSSERRVRFSALVLAALLLPALALAQAPPPGSAGEPGAGPGDGRGDGRGEGRGEGPPAEVRERVERRLRLARSLGLAEALDLDEAGTARLNAIMAPFDARKRALLGAVREDVRTLRQAARHGDPRTLGAVDGAVQRLFDARAAVLAIDREMFAAVAKDLPPGQVARAALFFAQFRQRFGMELPDARGGGAR